MQNIFKRLKTADKITYLGIAITIVLWFVIAAQYFDNDTYWIIANGREIVNNGIPKYHPYTMVEGLKIVIQQPLFSVLSYLSYHYFGEIGLLLLCDIQFLALIITYYKLFRIKGLNSNAAVLYVSLLLLLLLPYIRLRPSLITFVLLGLQMIICERRDKTKWFIPLLVILEANLHASFVVFHFVYLLPYIVPSILKRIENKADYQLLKVVPFMILGLFLNPYGLDAITYLFKSYSLNLDKYNIRELFPLSLSNYYTYGCILLLIAIVYRYAKDSPRLNSSDLYMFFGSTLLIILFNELRNYSLFIIGVLPLFATLYKDTNICFKFKKENIPKQLSIVVMMIILVLLPYRVYGAKTRLIKDSAYTPVAAVKYLKSVNAEKIYTSFNNGGYLEFRDLPIFIDARPELYKKKINGKANIIDELYDFDEAKTEKKRMKFINKYDFDYLILDNKSYAGETLLKNGYQLILKGKDYKLYGKEELVCQ